MRKLWHRTSLLKHDKTRKMSSEDADEEQVKKRSRAVPLFRVDLDEEPAERWAEIARRYGAGIRRLVSLAPRVMGAKSYGVLERVCEWLVGIQPAEYRDELTSMAREAGVSAGVLLISQYVYEIVAGCTSVVAPRCRANGRPVHLRTVDWPGQRLMSPLLIRVDFVRGERVLCRAVTWAGYLGVLTGLKPGVCSIAVNLRRSTSARFALMQTPLSVLDGARSVGFFVRALLTDASPEVAGELTYTKATRACRSAYLAAPCYLTLCGTRALEGCVLTRGRSRLEFAHTLATAPCCVQTNHDVTAESHRRRGTRRDEEGSGGGGQQPKVETWKTFGRSVQGVMCKRLLAAVGESSEGSADLAGNGLFGTQARFRMVKRALARTGGVVPTVRWAWALLNTAPVDNAWTQCKCILDPANGTLLVRTCMST